mmetsp:Transcript_11726/g.35592  ORF Transcript_11726/g.35592 Transcript_11726/m.35592 type:complete len:239 (-) Transcript_11726:66-782(-)
MSLGSAKSGPHCPAQHCANAALTAPHALESSCCPCRRYLPIVPSEVIPTCGPKRIRTLPLSGTWWENALNPVLPTNGAPEMPPMLKTSPNNLAYWSAMSPGSMLISSAQMLDPKMVFSGVMSLVPSTAEVRATRALPGRVPGKHRSMASATAEPGMGDQPSQQKAFCASSRLGRRRRTGRADPGLFIVLGRLGKVVGEAVGEGLGDSLGDTKGESILSSRDISESSISCTVLPAPTAT